MSVQLEIGVDVRDKEKGSSIHITKKMITQDNMSGNTRRDAGAGASRYVRITSSEPLVFQGGGGGCSGGGGSGNVMVLQTTTSNATNSHRLYQGLALFLQPVVAETALSACTWLRGYQIKVWNISPREYDELLRGGGGGGNGYRDIKVKLFFGEGHDPFLTATTDERRGKQHNKVFYESAEDVLVAGGVGYTRLSKSSDIENLFPRCRGFFRVDDALFHKIAVANRRHCKRWSFFTAQRRHLTVDMKFDNTVKPSDLVKNHGALAETLCFRVNTRNMGPHSGTGQARHCTSSIILQTTSPLDKLLLPHNLKIERILEREEHDEDGEDVEFVHTTTTKAVVSFFRQVDAKKIMEANNSRGAVAHTSIFQNIDHKLAKRVLGLKKVRVKVKMRSKKHAMCIAHKSPRKVFFDSKELRHCYFHINNTLDLEKRVGTVCGNDDVQFPDEGEFHEVTVLARRPRKRWCYYNGEELIHASFETPMTPALICTDLLAHVKPSFCFHANNNKNAHVYYLVILLKPFYIHKTLRR